MYLHDRGCPPKWRPDVCGIIATAIGIFRGHPVFALAEYRAGAFKSTRGQMLMRHINKSAILALYLADGGLGFIYERTGLVLDEMGKKELLACVDQYDEKATATIWADSVDFGGTPAGGMENVEGAVA